jgi:hypothetical protein
MFNSKWINNKVREIINLIIHNLEIIFKRILITECKINNFIQILIYNKIGCFLKLKMDW